MGDYAEQLVKNCAVVNCIVPLVRNAAPAVGAAITLKNHDHVTFVIQCGALAAVNAAVTITQDTAIAPTANVKALAFTQYWTNAANIASNVMVETVCASTFNLATAGATYVIEVDADSLDCTGTPATPIPPFDTLILNVAAGGAGDLLYNAVAILSKSRYAGASAAMSNVLID